MTVPALIQGGMGAAVSNWKLANAVARMGQLGVVSGTALDSVMARRLQLGDLDGAIRRALQHFPDSAIAKRILDRWFIAGGKPASRPFKNVPMFTLRPAKDLLELTVAANFAEVFLAREGHDGPVGINYLEKIQMPNLPSLYGAMLAGASYVLMGAGIPRAIPGIMDRLVTHQEVALNISMQGALPGETYVMNFAPRAVMDAGPAPLARPKFLAIVSSEVLGLALARKASGRVDGFVIEGPTAGGHNAPPRGALQVNDLGEPVYGTRDEVDLATFRELGVPFWLAGSFGNPAGLRAAQAQGAAGVQVGTVFAYCDESGLDAAIKRKVLEGARRGEVRVFTDPVASPTGFPFKVVRLPGTMSEPEVYRARARICDLGYLRSAYRQPDGAVGYRCASEPESAFIKKGGTMDETLGRKCVCNGLMADVGMAQVRPGGAEELPLVTSGDAVAEIAALLPADRITYTAANAVSYLLGHQPTL